MIGVRLPASFETAGEYLADAQALESAGADLLSIGEGDLHHPTLLAALAAVTSAPRLHAAAVSGPALETLRRLSQERLVADLEGWHEVAFPVDREEWRKTLAEHDERGTRGLILTMDPRLLDLLRNPEQEDDRTQDMQLAQG